MAQNKLVPEKYKIVSHENNKGGVSYFVVDFQGAHVCSCSKLHNAKLIRNLLEKFT